MTFTSGRHLQKWPVQDLPLLYYAIFESNKLGKDSKRHRVNIGIMFMELEYHGGMTAKYCPRV